MIDLSPDPLVKRLAQTVRSRLAGIGTDGVGTDTTGADVFVALREIEAFAYEAPVAAGGYDLGLGAGLVVGTELGRRALPDVYSGVPLVLDGLAATGDPAGRAAGLAAGEEGMLVAGLDLATAPRLRDRLVARRTGGGWRLAGAVTVEPAGVDAACVVPLVADDEVRLAPLPARVWRSGVRGPAPAGPTTVHLSGLSVADEDVAARLGSGDPLTDEDGVLARARIRQAAYLLGLGEGAHDLAVAHAAGRQQFDRAILDFQGVSFPLAREAVALAAARALVWRAAWLADAGRPFAREAVECLALAAESALRLVRLAVQVHGARGLSREYPVHASYLRARVAATCFGPPGRLWREAGIRRLAAGQAVRAEPAAVA